MRTRMFLMCCIGFIAVLRPLSSQALSPFAFNYVQKRPNL